MLSARFIVLQLGLLLRSQTRQRDKCELETRKVLTQHGDAVFVVMLPSAAS